MIEPLNRVKLIEVHIAKLTNIYTYILCSRNEQFFKNGKQDQSYLSIDEAPKKKSNFFHRLKIKILEIVSRPFYLYEMLVIHSWQIQNL